jgi:hypothetical protein
MNYILALSMIIFLKSFCSCQQSIETCIVSNCKSCHVNSCEECEDHFILINDQTCSLTIPLDLENALL